MQCFRQCRNKENLGHGFCFWLEMAMILLSTPMTTWAMLLVLSALMMRFVMMAPVAMGSPSCKKRWKGKANEHRVAQKELLWTASSLVIFKRPNSVHVFILFTHTLKHLIYDMLSLCLIWHGHLHFVQRILGWSHLPLARHLVVGIWRWRNPFAHW